MARARNIKPGFFKNEELAELSPLTRLLFAGLWTLADREGRLEDRPKRIRAEILPYDDGSVDEMLNELHRAGFILRYSSGDKRLIQIENFSKHQNPHCKEPDSTIPAPCKHGASTAQERNQNRSCPADSLNPITDSLNPLQEGSGTYEVEEESGTPKQASPTRKGLVCGLLRKAGMADAAPHYLPDDAWETILAKRTDEEIVELARAKMAANPGRRIGLKYIAPALLEDPQRIEANARDSPAGRRKTLTETRTATIAGLTGGRTTTPKEQQRESIESTAVRIAG